jgi:heme-NO-binding protein
MHGIIFTELREFVSGRLGKDAWPQLLSQCRLQFRNYGSTQNYPDEEAGRLMQEAAAASQLPVPDFLEAFGQFLAADLMRLGGTRIRPEWKTLEFLEHAEEHIHSLVRLQSIGATPPALLTKRVAPDEVLIEYRSQRRMCGLAKGIAQGVAAHYQETIVITEPRCMLAGDGSCEIRIRKASPSS